VTSPARYSLAMDRDRSETRLSPAPDAAARLRANLLRRKAQARARDAAEAEIDGGAPTRLEGAPAAPVKGPRP